MAEWGRDTPWRQGFLLTSETCAALGLLHHESPERTLVVIVTHDCDLVQLQSSEPYVEVIVGCLIDHLDGNHTHAKSSRKLHIEFNGETPLLAEFDATHKTRISKEKLSSYSPEEKVRFTPEKFSIYQYWLASRYRRSAFPDEFERRLTVETKLAKKIAKAVEPHGENISGIFFDVDEGEDVKRDGPEDTYTLDIYILHPSEPDYETAETAARQAAVVIEQAFRDKLYNKPMQTWNQIELRSCEVLSENTLTYQHFKQMKRWRLEHMSLAEDPQQQVLAE